MNNWYDTILLDKSGQFFGFNYNDREVIPYVIHDEISCQNFNVYQMLKYNNLYNCFEDCLYVTYKGTCGFVNRGTDLRKINFKSDYFFYVNDNCLSIVGYDDNEIAPVTLFFDVWDVNMILKNLNKLDNFKQALMWISQYAREKYTVGI